MDPRGNKGTTHKLSEIDFVCVDKQYTVSGQAQIRFHTGVSKVQAPQYSVGESTFPFYILYDSYRDGMDSICVFHIFDI